MVGQGFYEADAINIATTSGPQPPQPKLTLPRHTYYSLGDASALANHKRLIASKCHVPGTQSYYCMGEPAVWP